MTEIQTPNDTSNEATFDQLIRYHQALKQLKKVRDFNQLKYWTPTTKQKHFHDLGSRYRFRMFMANNQSGKTLTAGNEVAFHLTGRYPTKLKVMVGHNEYVEEPWKGKRWNRPIVGWASGITGEETRDTVQRILFGRATPGSQMWGSGTVPRECILDYKLAAVGVPDLLDFVDIRHESGGVSRLGFKFNKKGREKYQGETLDLGWEDEEHDTDVHTEFVTRLNKRKGLLLITFTPLKGMTEVVQQFYDPPADDLGARQRALVQMSLNDCFFYSPEEMEEIENQYPESVRRARVQGLPDLGEGRLYPIDEREIKVDAFQLPDHFHFIVGLDIGIGHPTAAVWCAYDGDTDTIYIYDCYKVADEVISTHASAIRSRGDWIPVAWPHDAIKRDPKSGDAFADLYSQEGVFMLPMSARHNLEVGGGQSREKSIMENFIRMKTGRFKVFSHLEEWFKEFRMYHRKDGKIVDMNDDLMSATNYAIMMLLNDFGQQRTVERLQTSYASI